MMSASASTSLRLIAAVATTTNIPKSLINPSSSSLTTTTTTTTTTKPTKLSFSTFSKPVTFHKNPTKTRPLQSASASTSMSLQPIEELPPKLQEIVKLFQSVTEPKAKYEQLLFYGKNLKPLDPHLKTRDNKVEGCVSQVWVRAYLRGGDVVFFEADSDSVLTKGLAALLVQGLSGSPVHEVLRVSPDFAVLLGLQQSLTPSRNNGFLNMLKLMQKKALELYVESQKNSGSVSGLRVDEKVAVENEAKVASLGSDLEKSDVGVSSVDNSVNSESESVKSEAGARETGSSLGSRGMRIKEILERELSPVELELEDISYQHAGHAGVRGSDGETHFNLKIVSNEFEGKSLVKRHRLVYSLLQDELQSGLHALSIVAKTPNEVDGK